jgi:hypothetical protein
MELTVFANYINSGSIEHPIKHIYRRVLRGTTYDPEPSILWKGIWLSGYKRRCSLGAGGVAMREVADSSPGLDCKTGSGERVCPLIHNRGGETLFESEYVLQS